MNRCSEPVSQVLRMLTITRIQNDQNEQNEQTEAELLTGNQQPRSLFESTLMTITEITPQMPNTNSDIFNEELTEEDRNRSIKYFDLSAEDV